MTTTTGPTLNPWFSMWTRPRESIQQIVDRDPRRLVLLLAAVAGVAQALDSASGRNAGDDSSLVFILSVAVIGGPVFGIIGLYIASILISWTGGWLGGTASLVNLRAAIAWSGVLSIWALALWVPELALFGHQMFTSDMPILRAQPGLLYVFAALVVAEITIGVWHIVVLLKSVGQVQGFSAWKALANILLAMLVIIVPILLLVLAFAPPADAI